jgi:hypothetical protein
VVSPWDYNHLAAGNTLICLGWLIRESSIRSKLIHGTNHDQFYDVLEVRPGFVIAMQLDSENIWDALVSRVVLPTLLQMTQPYKPLTL